jgi:predicted  nucleic acid-binding Zn-ribbon protein
VEAELQRVLSLRRRAARIEARVDAINERLGQIDAARQSSVSYEERFEILGRQHADLRDERAGLEMELSPLHDEIAELLAKLGGDAGYPMQAPPTARDGHD